MSQGWSFLSISEEEKDKIITKAFTEIMGQTPTTTKERMKY